MGEVYGNPRKHKTLAQCCSKAGTPTGILPQKQNSINGSTFLINVSTLSHLYAHNHNAFPQWIQAVPLISLSHLAQTGHLRVGAFLRCLRSHSPCHEHSTGDAITDSTDLYNIMFKQG